MNDALPNAFLSAEPSPPADTAAAALTFAGKPAAAGPIPEPFSNEGRHQGASAVEDRNPDAAGATNHIHEIFVGARKWIDDDHRFILDEEAFLAAIEDVPLFLRRA